MGKPVLGGSEFDAIFSGSDLRGADAIALKVKQEFAAKEKTQTGKKSIAKTQPKTVKKAKAA